MPQKKTQKRLSRRQRKQKEFERQDEESEKVLRRMYTLPVSADYVWKHVMHRDTRICLIVCLSKWVSDRLKDIIFVHLNNIRMSAAFGERMRDEMASRGQTLTDEAMEKARANHFAKNDTCRSLFESQIMRRLETKTDLLSSFGESSLFDFENESDANEAVAIISKCGKIVRMSESQLKEALLAFYSASAKSLPPYTHALDVSFSRVSSYSNELVLSVGDCGPHHSVLGTESFFSFEMAYKFMVDLGDLSAELFCGNQSAFARLLFKLDVLVKMLASVDIVNASHHVNEFAKIWDGFDAKFEFSKHSLCHSKDEDDAFARFTEILHISLGASGTLGGTNVYTEYVLFMNKVRACLYKLRALHGHLYYGRGAERSIRRYWECPCDERQSFIDREKHSLTPAEIRSEMAFPDAVFEKTFDALMSKIIFRFGNRGFKVYWTGHAKNNLCFDQCCAFRGNSNVCYEIAVTRNETRDLPVDAGAVVVVVDDDDDDDDDDDVVSRSVQALSLCS